MLVLAAALLLLVRARRRPALAGWVGLLLAFSYVIRPTNSISIAVLGLYVALRHRAQLPWVILGAVAVAVPFVGYNVSTYHALLAPYYRASRLGAHGEFITAFLGHLVAPSRGVLVYSPVLLYAIHGAVVGWKDPLVKAVVAAIALHAVALGSFAPWTAGNSYGPRYWCDMMPYAMFLLAFSLRSLAARRARAAILGLALAVGASVFIHHRGVTSWAVYNWNIDPNGIDENRLRAWDPRDPQFLRGL
jgi:hypothetical protein